jgi:hypothetical protein
MRPTDPDERRTRFRRPLGVAVMAYKAALGLSEILVGVLLAVPSFDPQADVRPAVGRGAARGPRRPPRRPDRPPPPGPAPPPRPGRGRADHAGPGQAGRGRRHVGGPGVGRLPARRDGRATAPLRPAPSRGRPHLGPCPASRCQRGHAGRAGPAPARPAARSATPGPTQPPLGRCTGACLIAARIAHGCPHRATGNRDCITLISRQGAIDYGESRPRTDAAAPHREGRDGLLGDGGRLHPGHRIGRDLPFFLQPGVEHLEGAVAVGGGCWLPTGQQVGPGTPRCGPDRPPPGGHHGESGTPGAIEPTPGRSRPCGRTCSRPGDAARRSGSGRVALAPTWRHRSTPVRWCRSAMLAASRPLSRRNRRSAAVSTGRGAAWSAHLLWEQGVAGSNPAVPTTSTNPLLSRVPTAPHSADRCTLRLASRFRTP